MSFLERKAAALAAFLHRDHKRRYSGEPYFEHLKEVAGYAKEAGLGPVAVSAGFLHDSIEDVGASHMVIVDALSYAYLPRFLARIVSYFRVDPVAVAVADLVVWMTDPEIFDADLKAKNRKARKAAKVVKMAGAPADAKSLKLCDMLSNTKDIAANDPDFAKVYLLEMDALLSALVGGNADLWKRVANAISSAKVKIGLVV